ncbi:Uncharacterised protein [Lelliottia amnigena]|nr:Uncharacterised protein [Lelliottia amnigena]
MFKSLLSKFIKDKTALSLPVEPLYTIQPEGLAFAFHLADNKDNWLVVSCLEQLHEEDYVSHWSDCWFLSWDDFYRLNGVEDYATSLGIFAFPPQRELVAHLSSSGSISDDNFRVIIDKWTHPEDYRVVEMKRTGASFSTSEGTFILNSENWHLIDSLKQLRQQQSQQPGEAVNQMGWAKIRRQAKKACAKMDDYLTKTIVVRPESLQLKLREARIADTKVYEIEPTFEDQPVNWLQSFDRTQQVQDRYRVLGEDGELNHVILSPEVKEVLSSVHAITGRRVAGDDALSFIRNPYSWVGEDASKVLDPDVYEKDLQEAGIYFYDFRLEPNFSEQNEIAAVSLILSPRTETPQADETFNFTRPFELESFIKELQLKLASDLPVGIWQGYDIELGRLTSADLESYQSLVETWQKQAEGMILHTYWICKNTVTGSLVLANLKKSVHLTWLKVKARNGFRMMWQKRCVKPCFRAGIWTINSISMNLKSVYNKPRILKQLKSLCPGMIIFCREKMLRFSMINGLKK